MPMANFMRTVNKHVFNPREIRKGDRPRLVHVGRSSGNVYRTPLDAHEVEGGFIFVMVYGPRSDWVRNILAAGKATLEIGRETIELESPRVVGRDEVPATVYEPPGLLNVTDYLWMDRIG